MEGLECVRPQGMLNVAGGWSILGASPESCAQVDFIQEGMSQVDSLRDSLFYGSSLYTTGHGLCIL